MTIRLPDLPYAYDALAPHMSAKTLALHHAKHHRGYVDKLNALLEESKMTNLSLDEIVQKSAGSSDLESLFNNAAQCWNHSFFWTCLSPHGGGEPDGDLARSIEEDLGGLEAFKQEFLTAAKNRFGSGWAWLVLDNGRLKITSTPNAVPPTVHGQQPLLTCDVWEHAYYLDYQNRRGDFVQTFLDKLVNWPFVAEQYALQGEGSSAAGRRHQDEQRDFVRSRRAAAGGS